MANFVYSKENLLIESLNITYKYNPENGRVETLTTPKIIYEISSPTFKENKLIVEIKENRKIIKVLTMESKSNVYNVITPFSGKKV